MGRSPSTLKINPEQLEALENLSKLEGRPVNELLREAIRYYLRRRYLNNPEGTVSDLRAYRKQDPRFQRAIEEFGDAEARFEDPLEGELVESQSDDPNLAGPVQRKIRDIFDS